MTTVPLYRVTADRETGEWDARTLERIGETDFDEHCHRQDTSDVHFDHFDRPIGEPREGETELCAIEVHWA